MKVKKKVFWLCGLMLFLLLGSTGISYGQLDYPSKPVTILVPYEPGGVSDIVSRIISDVGRKYSPQPFVVVNRAGASGTSGILELINSKADGYTIAFASNAEACSALHIIPAKYTIDSYTIICRVGLLPATISTVGPWNNLKDLVEHAKKTRIKSGQELLGSERSAV